MPFDERLFMRLEVIKAEVNGELSALFRAKVQLEEQLEENEVKIHFNRGILEAFERLKQTAKEIAESDKIAELEAEQTEELKAEEKEQ